MDPLENAGRQPGRIYRDGTMYTTLSPCAMCSGFSFTAFRVWWLAKIERFAARKTYFAAVG